MRFPRSALHQPAEQVGKDLHQRPLSSRFRRAVLQPITAAAAGCNCKVAPSSQRSLARSKPDCKSPVTRGFMRLFGFMLVGCAIRAPGFASTRACVQNIEPDLLVRCFGQHNFIACQLCVRRPNCCTTELSQVPHVFATSCRALVLWGDAHTDYCRAPAHLQPPQTHQTLIICASPPRRRAASRRNATMR